MQYRDLSGKTYKPLDTDFNNSYGSKIKTQLKTLTRLRKAYEERRPRLLFLKENNPTSQEYKELRKECQAILQAADEIKIGKIL